jgi:peptide/nickel transport system substrate-binding protein
MSRPAAVCVLAMLILGCGRGGSGVLGDGEDVGRLSPERERDRGTLVVARAADIVGLDPARISDADSIEVAEQIFEHLVDVDAAGQVVPRLAERWQVAADGKSATFNLRPGVRFHDGTPLDAAAVVFSFERQLDPANPAHRPDMIAWRNLFAGLVNRVVIVDPLTVRIDLERPYAPLLAALSLAAVAIVSPTAVHADVDGFARHPVGTGPFRFVEWVPGERVVVAVNHDYWGPRPRLARLVFRTIPDARQRLVALEGGAADLAIGILPEELQFVELHPDLQLIRSPAFNVAYLAMNTQRPPFGDLRVRQAVSHAINKSALVSLAFQGTATMARGPVPPAMWGAARDLPQYPYAPDQARRLLEAAAADHVFDPARHYTLYAPTTPRRYLPEPIRVARAIQGNLEAVGFRVDLVLADLPTHIAAVERGDHDLCLLGWTADFPDPDSFLMLLSTDTAQPGAARNLAFYRDAEVSSLLQLGQTASDQAVRTQHYEEAQRRIALAVPWVPLAHADVVVAARNDVHGVIILATSLVDYSKVWLGP